MVALIKLESVAAASARKPSWAISGARNRKRDAGREALEKKGWWRSHRWLVLRRLCQFFVLGMFLSGPWFGVWILHGNTAWSFYR